MGRGLDLKAAGAPMLNRLCAVVRPIPFGALFPDTTSIAKPIKDRRPQN
jgi:hypothetical protein